MLIGITGRKRSGKSALASALAERHGFVHVSFAEPIRRFIADILGIDLADLETLKERPIDWLDGRTPRQLMQSIGTEWGRRMIHNELWIRSLARKLDRAETNYVISDLRFPNEAAIIRERGGQVIRLLRPGADSSDDHASEAPLPDALVDIQIVNDGSLQHLVEVAERTLGLDGDVLRMPVSDDEE